MQSYHTHYDEDAGYRWVGFIRSKRAKRFLMSRYINRQRWITQRCGHMGVF